jgi:hypothetical protein
VIPNGATTILSRRNEMLGFCVVMLVIGFAIAIGCAIWRCDMAINHPEKYARFREWEKGMEDKQKQALSAAFKPFVPVGKHVGKSIVRRILTKR